MSDETTAAIEAARDVLPAAEDLEVRLRRMGMKLSALIDHLDELRQARDDATS